MLSKLQQFHIIVMEEKDGQDQLFAYVRQTIPKYDICSTVYC